MISGRNTFLMPLLLAIILFACRKESTRWDVDLLVPLAKGKLGISSLLPDSLLSTDQYGIVHLKYEKDLINIDLDTLAEIPDTIVHKMLSPGLGGGSFNVPSGFEVATDDQETYYDLGSVQIKQVKVQSGQLRYVLKNYMNANLDFIYELPGVSLNGIQVMIEESTSPGTASNPDVKTSVIDLSDYTIDFTGDGDPGYNTFLSSISAITSPEIVGGATINGNDSITVDLIFENVVLSYARGYFGQATNESYNEDEISVFQNLSAALFEVEAVSLDIQIVNTVGIDAIFQIETFGGRSANGLEVVLASPGLNDPIYLARATDYWGNVEAGGSFNLHLDENNSNLPEFIGLLPKQIFSNIRSEINPLGNISQGNDFIYTNQPVNANVSFDLPLCFKANALTLRDTLEIEDAWDEESIEGILKLRAVNAFPFSASITLKIIDDNGDLVASFASNKLINSGILNADYSINSVESVIDIELQQGNLNAISPDHLWLIEVVFDTYGDDFVKIKEEYFIDLRILADMNYKVELE